MNEFNKTTLLQAEKDMCRANGTLELILDYADLFNETVKKMLLLDIQAKQHIFNLERDENLNLNFYYSSPGTGTRIAKINLKIIEKVEKVMIIFSWSPEKIDLHIGTILTNGLISATGTMSDKQLKMGKDGILYHIENINQNIKKLNIYKEGKLIVQSTAIEAWHETILAIDILSKDKSNEDFMYNAILANTIITMLVTGFEAYTKKRFLELEEEGKTPNIDKIIITFKSKKEIELGIAKILKKEAEEKNISLLEYIVSRKIINFQNFQKCKIAYNKAYNIKFGMLDLRSEVFIELQKFIEYRHKIIHISALITIFNQEYSSTESPIFSNRELADIAKKHFTKFIEKLHVSTLKNKSVPVT